MQPSPGDSHPRSYPRLSPQAPPERVAPQIRELDERARNEIYEAVKRPDDLIPRLQQMPMAELLEQAQKEGVETTPGLARQELIFQILRRRVTSTGLGWAEGVLDIHPDGFGFLRSRRYSYAAGPDDIYVSPSQIRRLNLKPGHEVAGPVRPPKDGEKYFALLHVEVVNGATIGELRKRIPFADLTPLLPASRLRLEHAGADLDLRLLDLLAPVGKGQRVLVQTPPLSGRNRLLAHVVQGLLANHPELYVIVLLADARPEEVPEFERNTGPDERREIVASTFDEPPARHIALAELVLERACRLVEAGRDVVLVADSLTALTRTYNVELPHSGKILSAGLDASSVVRPKRLFGAARRTEEAGSLTVYATVLTDTGTRVNDVIVEEFRGKANSEIVLDRHLAELHFAPAIDVARTGTRLEDNLLEPAELEQVRALRRRIDAAEPARSLETLLKLVRETATNAELLARL
jgi:transcription termination factor Rho